MSNFMRKAKQANPEVMSIVECCRELNCGLSNLYRILKKANMVTRKLGDGTPYLLKSDLDSLIFLDKDVANDKNRD